MATKVYIVNKSAHDFSSALEFGKLVFMSEGRINRFGTNDMIRKFQDAMRNSESTDYLLPCSLNTANIMAAAVFALKHKRLNLLLFKPATGEYISRVHVFE